MDAEGTASAVSDLSSRFPVVTKAVVYTVAALIGYKVASLAVKIAINAVKAPILDARVAYEKLAGQLVASSERTRAFSAAQRGVNSTSIGLSRNVALSTARLRQFAVSANSAATSTSRLAAAQSKVRTISIGDLSVGGIGKGGVGNAARLGGKALGAAGFAINAGLAVSDLMDNSKTAQEKAGSVGNLAGGLAGAAAGAAIGSVVPVIGTALGGVIGGMLGAFGGEALGEHLFKGRSPSEASEAVESGKVGGIGVNDNGVNDNAFRDYASPKSTKSNNVSQTYNQTFNFTISAAPGQSPETIAGAIKRTIDVNSGGELYDKY